MSKKRKPDATSGQRRTASSVDGLSASRLLHTVPEAAATFNLSPSWLYARTRTNEIPFRRFGKYIRFTDDDLAAIIATRAANLKNGAE